MDFFEEGPAYADTNVVRVFDLEVVAGDYRQALTMPGQLFIPLSVAQKFFGETDVIGRTVLFNGAREMTVAAVYRDVPLFRMFFIRPLSVAEHNGRSGIMNRIM